MSYRVTVAFVPAHELVMSLDAYMVTPSHRTLDLGDDWVQATRARLSPAFAAELAANPEPLDHRLLGLLISQCPVPEFVTWLAGQPAGELYERLAPFGRIELDLTAFRDRSVSLLSQWHEQYFQQIDPAIVAGLAAEAARIRRLGEGLAPELLVEEATRGYYLSPSPAIQEVRLVPQYHKRPITLQAQAGGTWLFYFPAGDFPGRPGEPPAELLRLTRTLADESRLRIVHLLAGGPHSFAEVGQQTGLTKGTVHRHLWALRFAGLVRCDLSAGRFSLRPGALERLCTALAQFTAHR